ncbi:MAG TPA: 2-succinyl-5-enolpyruvyl-6-hydroxy-3-cyclohexene-1-carboxylic-acid synthase, partial [Polyangiaceae bacterium]
MTPLNLQDQWARLLISSLKAAGVEHVNVTPGSRSTPWTWAALQQPGLCCHLHIDERSAAFFALGQAKATGAPSLLICTSGSAVANYFPAVIEANASRTPLLVLSADRPFELQGVDAPQTIDQTKLFGSHCRRYLDLGVPSARHSALRALARTAVQAVHATQYPEPGPVQLNARASKPLEPQSAEGELASSLEREVETLVLAGPTRASTPTAQADVAAIRRCAESAVAAARGLILCGPEPMASQKHAGPLWEFASATGFLVLCEAASQRRFAVPQGFPDAQVCDGFPTLFGLDE